MVITALARAKINLSLDIIRKRADGYHDLETVMQSIELYDRIEFRPDDREISLSAEGDAVPSGRDNLVCRAAEKLRTACSVQKGVQIRLIKNIPVGAGLGGGSSDAAAALLALNNMWQTGLTLEQLMKIGGQIGSDVPFCLLGGTAIARGRGELLEKLPPCPGMGLVLVKPPFAVSTASVYRAFSPAAVYKRPDNPALENAIRHSNINKIAKNLANVLEQVTIKMYPVIAEIKKKLVEAGAMAALMSGSGPTVFGLTADIESARAVAGRYSGFDGQVVLVTRTFNQEE